MVLKNPSFSFYKKDGSKVNGIQLKSDEDKFDVILARNLAYKGVTSTGAMNKETFLKTPEGQKFKEMVKQKWENYKSKNDNSIKRPAIGA